MATSKALVIQTGQRKQLPDTDSLLTGTGVDRSDAGAYTVGGTNATSIDLGAAGVPSAVKGNLTTEGDVTLGDASSDTITFSGELAGGVAAVKESNHALTISASTAEGTAGGNWSLTSGAGAAATGSSPGAAGGTVTFTGGTGGADDGALGSGAGGAVSLLGGDAGAESGGGGANGGAVTVDAGAASTGGTNGAVTIGGTNASSVAIGRAGITTTVSGVFAMNTQFKIGGTAVGAAVTAANLDTLTDGSNADSLHTHSATVGDHIKETGLDTDTNSLGDGDFGYISAADTLNLTDTDVLASSRVVGANNGTSGEAILYGIVENAKFTTDGGSPAVGAPVYLASGSDDTSTGTGKLTATAPTSGHLVECGYCLDDSNYAGSKTAKIAFRPGEVIAL